MTILYKKQQNNINNNIELKYFLLKLIKFLDISFPFFINIKNFYINLYKIYYKFYIINNFNYININILYNINNKIIFNYSIYKLFPINNNILLINNIKKIFINRLSNIFGLFFNYIKKNLYIYCLYFKNKLNIINIFINKNNKLYLKFNNLIIINLIKFLNFNGFSNIFIYYNFKNIFNKTIIYNIIKSNYTNIINNKIKFYLNLLTNKDIKIILIIIKIILNIKYNKYNLIDIDHFNNKYIETWKNFIHENILISLDRYINNIHINYNYMNFLLNLNKTIKENILINPLCQNIYQYNINFNIENKNNKISLIGPKSLFEKNNFNLKLKSLHLSQLGNICILDTYENFKCGLILNMPIKTYINIYGNIIKELNGLIKNNKRYNKFYINIKNLEKIKINFTDIKLKKNKLFTINKFITLNKGEYYINNIKDNNKNLIFKNFSNIFSYLINVIPFLNFNDPLRILMGSKMLNQSLKILYNENPLIKTDIYYNSFNFQNIKSLTHGIVIKINKFYIKIKISDSIYINYYLQNLFKCKVWEGERVLLGDILAYNIENIKCYGKNLLITYNYFNGYEFEDAFIVNNNLIYNYIMSSIKFNKYIIKFIKNKQKIEYSTFNIPKINKIYKYNLNKKFGIPKKNKYFNNIYMFLGKISIKNNIFLKYNYFNYIFGFIFKKIINKSIFLNYDNNFNKLTKILIKNLIDLNYFLYINFIILTLNNLNIGDKLSGRYGNKGVISLILNKIDLPYNIKGNTPDIIINPLSIVSRMNNGQFYEGLFGIISLLLNKIFIIKSNIIINYKFIKNFIYNYYNNISQKFNFNKYSYNRFKNPQNGYYLINKNIMLNSYFLKLIHLSSDKINKRSININNKYYLITQQPIKGIKYKGGQRFGEMELWALNAYKGIYNINELFNKKSDNIMFRYNYIKNKINKKNYYFTESYILLLKELFNLFILYKPINIIYKK